MYLVSLLCRSFPDVWPQTAAYAFFQYNPRGFLRQPGFAAVIPSSAVAVFVCSAGSAARLHYPTVPDTLPCFSPPAVLPRSQIHNPASAGHPRSAEPPPREVGKISCIRMISPFFTSFLLPSVQSALCSAASSPGNPHSTAL